MTEKTLQKLFITFLQHNKIYYVKTITCSRAGVPDILACIRGAFYAFELKSSAGIESDLQKYNGEKIQLSGGVYILLTPDNYQPVIQQLIALIK